MMVKKRNHIKAYRLFSLILLIHGDFFKSSTRRTWVDTHLGLIDPEYKKVLNKYNTVLRNRNALLSKTPSVY